MFHHRIQKHIQYTLLKPPYSAPSAPHFTILHKLCKRELILNENLSQNNMNHADIVRSHSRAPHSLPVFTWRLNDFLSVVLLSLHACHPRQPSCCNPHHTNVNYECKFFFCFLQVIYFIGHTDIIIIYIQCLYKPIYTYYPRTWQ